MPEIGKDYQNRKTRRLVRVVNISGDQITIYHSNGHTAIRTLAEFNREFFPEPLS